MLKHRVAPMLALLFLAFFAQSAQALIDPPWITPAAPSAGETVSVNIRLGGCDAILGRDGFPQITQEGNAIRILEYGDYDDFFCTFPLGTVTDIIGNFPVGTYALTVDMAYVDGFGVPQILSIGSIPFTVTVPQAVAAPVPAVGTTALLELILAISAVAAATRCRRL